ncbi:MAG: histidine kinase [Saprospiraceae bacterium]|nr:histidine kinase [Saprospiraceae bacterium]
MIRFFFVLVFLMTAWLLSGQSSSVRQYAEAAGLVRADVTVVFEDSRGMLWVGTRGAGLYQFNLGRFQQKIETVRTLGYEIRGLTEGPDGTLYVWSGAGTFSYDGDTFAPLGGSDDGLRQIAVCADSLWLAGQHGLDYGTARTPILEQAVQCVTCTDDDALVAVGTDSLWIIHGDRILAYALPASAWHAVAVQDQELWLADRAGTLLRFDQGQVHPYRTGLAINTLLPSGTGQLFLGTESGLHVFTGDEALTYPVEDTDGLLSQPVQHMIYDRAFRLWVGSRTNGLLQYQGSRVREWTLGRSVTNPALAGDPVRGGLLLLDDSGTLARVDQDGEMDPVPVTEGITAFHIDAIGRLWVAASGSMQVWLDREAHLQLDTLFNKPLENVALIADDPAGSVWLETGGHQVYRLGLAARPGSVVPAWTVQELSLPIRDDPVVLLPRDDLTMVRVGQHSVGIIREDAYQLLLETDFRILAATLDHGNVLWLGTEAGGIRYLDLTLPDQLHVLIAPYALQPYDLQFISVEEQALWVGTDRSILHLALTPERTGVRTVSEVVRTLPGTFSPASIARTSYGTIVAGGRDRIYEIQLATYRPAGVTPGVYLSEITIDQTPLPETRHRASAAPFGAQSDPLNISFRENKLAFTFEGISETPQITYAWRLTPLYPDWSAPSSRNGVQFAGLPPDDYAFDVQVCNDQGRCAQLAQPWKFTIRKGLHHQWWFWGGCLLLAGGLITWVVRRRTARLRREAAREQARLRARLETLALEQKALRLQMNPHFMFNAVQTIQQQIRQGRLDEAGSHLGQFSRLMRATLEMSRQELVSLEDEVAYLTAYLDLEQMCHPAPLMYTIHVDPAIEAFAIMIPPMLIQPLLENAVKHGTSHPSPRIDVRFSLHGEVLEVCVEDNGSGFDRPGSHAHTSAALAIIKERLSHYSKRARLELTNRMDENGKVAGARVVAVIPVRESGT